jgi:hydrogenase maturation protease
MKKILIYGYGNPGRQDDGLGNTVVERMEEWVREEGIENVEFDSNYQLNIEDAATISDKDLVIFVDASVEDIEDFILTPVDESAKVAFSSHSASPGYIVKLCHDLFDTQPASYLLHIKGYEWEFMGGLTENAKENLEKSLELLKEKVRNPEELISSFVPTELCEN